MILGAGLLPEFCLTLCVLCVSSFQNVHFMSFGRSFPEVMSILSPVLITVMGPSIKEVHIKGRVVMGNGYPYKNDLFPQ